MSARYFDRQDDIPYSLGMFMEFMPGQKRHQHLSARMISYPEAVVYSCDECDAFAWRPR